MRRLCLFSVVMAICVVAALITLAGCGGGGHSGPYVNKYLTDCFVEDDGTITVEIALPDDHFGLLFIEDSVLAFPPVVNSGTHNLGYLPQGDTTLVLRLEREFLPPTNSAFVINLTGFEEFCTFWSPGEPVAEPDPGPDPDPDPDPELDPVPTFACHVNLEGGVTITITLNGAEGCLLRRVGDPENDVLITEDYSEVFDAPLVPGTYTFRLFAFDYETVFAECIVEIPDPEPEPEPDEDDCELRKWKRYTLCYRGRCIIAKGKRACKLIERGATLGPCRGDDDDEEDDD